MFLDHVDVVQQPLAGWPDVVVPLLGGGEPVVGVGDDPAGLVQSLEQVVTGPGGPRGEPLRLGQGPRALGQALGTEQLAPDRAGDELVEGGTGAAAVQAAGDGAERGAGDGDSRAAVRDEIERNGR